MNKAPKPLRVLWNGKPLRNIYPHATRFQVFKYKIRRFFRKCLIVFSVCLAGYTLIQIGSFVNPSIEYRVEAKEIIKDTLTPKIKELKDTVIKDIQNCERAGHSEEDSIHVEAQIITS